MTVQAGKIIEIVLDGYSGSAGFVETEKGAALSFSSSVPLRVAPGAIVNVDGRTWTVASVGASQFVRGFKVVELRPQAI
jgi:hypothetical protein